MAPLTTSGSGFHVIFEFRVLELIENNINIGRLCGRFFEILGVKVENLKNYAYFWNILDTEIDCRLLLAFNVLFLHETI